MTNGCEVKTIFHLTGCEVKILSITNNTEGSFHFPQIGASYPIEYLEVL